MTPATILDHLRSSIGMNPASVAPGAVPGAVAARMRALGLGDAGAYAARLADDPAEQEALAEEVVVPETWFFRGGGLFAHLAGRARAALRDRGPGAPFRALSVPCSTGEEPYSLAIALREAGVPDAAFLVEGVDLSRRHVERARRGLFTDFSFRQTPRPLRERYFRLGERGWELDAGLRRKVRFRQGNLLDPALLAGEPPFDLVLCRNLFIYLTPDARRQALAALDRLLAADGWLGMGHAEPLDPADRRFRPVGPVGFFLYARAPAAPVVPHIPTPRPAPPAPAPAPAAAEGLPRARRLADAGRLREALAACQEELGRAGPSAEAYNLLGVVSQALHDDDGAARAWERALYLRPDDPEALLHLMLLCRRRGDGARAELLRRRLGRAGGGGEP